jgi:hypothetical protein
MEETVMIGPRRIRLTVLAAAFPAVPPSGPPSARIAAPTPLPETLRMKPVRSTDLALTLGLSLVANHAYSAPYEDLRLKKP